MSRTCDGLRAVNVGGGGAEVLSGGRSGLSLRGARGGGCPRPFWVVGARSGGYFFRPAGSFSQGCQGLVLRRVQSESLGAAPGGLLGGKGAVCARAVFAGLFCQTALG